MKLFNKSNSTGALVSFILLIGGILLLPQWSFAGAGDGAGGDGITATDNGVDFSTTPRMGDPALFQKILRVFSTTAIRYQSGGDYRCDIRAFESLLSVPLSEALRVHRFESQDCNFSVDHYDDLAAMVEGILARWGSAAGDETFWRIARDEVAHSNDFTVPQKDALARALSVESLGSFARDTGGLSAAALHVYLAVRNF